MKHTHIEQFFEFLVIGIVLGVTEDLIAVKLATGQAIDLQVIAVVVAVAVPFAVISELIVDRKDFVELLGLRKFEEKFLPNSEDLD